MSTLALVLLAACTAWTTLGWLAVRRVARSGPARRRSDTAPLGEVALPPVSVLKPLRGADVGLAANLESFFTQDYPALELVFGVEDPLDAALPVVAALSRRYPHVACRVVVHGGGRAINPKVRNLQGMVPRASHELLLVSDSNVRVPPHYVREMVEVLRADPEAGLVTSLFAGQGEDSLGSALENVQLNGFCAAGATLPTAAGEPAVIGKSLLFSRTVFERLGGFARVADVLAEDYVMGKMFQRAGYRVRLATTVVDNVTAHTSVEGFLQRHLRWSMLRLRLQPSAFALEPLTSPLALLPLGLVGVGPEALVWAVTLLLLRDVGGWVALRGWRRAWIPLLLSPVRELCMLGVWLHTPLQRHVTWRGHRVRVGAGTQLSLQVG